uniref:Retrotrans_gag domain-containing protein n=1 Tax=Caenorhabditis japonica TaxID=281687 RepID=A0A8R1IIA2_CAEJA
MTSSSWVSDTCLPRFTGNTTVQSSHLLALKNAVVLDFNSINARMREATSQGQAEMSAIAQQFHQRGNSVKAVEQHVEALRQRIEEIEGELVAKEVTGAPSVGLRRDYFSPKSSSIRAKAVGEGVSGLAAEGSACTRNPTVHVTGDVVRPPASEQRGVNPEVRSEPGTKSKTSNQVRGNHVPHVNVANFKSSTTINPYSGAFSESLTSFVRQFKDHTLAADASASEEMKRYSFLTFLTGNARDRAEDFMTTKAEATVDEIIGDLRLTFENELTGQLREEQFNKCRQGRGEPIEAYYNRVRTLASQAFRAEDRATIEKKTRDAFLDGLEDAIRYNVKDKNPRTSRSAFDEALRQEILRDDRAAAAQHAPTAAIFEEIRVLNEKWDSQHTQRK